MLPQVRQIAQLTGVPLMGAAGSWEQGRPCWELACMSHEPAWPHDAEAARAHVSADAWPPPLRR